MFNFNVVHDTENIDYEMTSSSIPRVGELLNIEGIEYIVTQVLYETEKTNNLLTVKHLTVFISTLIQKD